MSPTEPMELVIVSLARLLGDESTPFVRPKKKFLLIYKENFNLMCIRILF